MQNSSLSLARADTIREKFTTLNCCIILLYLNFFGDTELVLHTPCLIQCCDYCHCYTITAVIIVIVIP